MMKQFPRVCAASILFVAGVTSSAAASLDCPVVPEVLAQAKGAARNISIEQLGTKISETVTKGRDLHLIANRLKMELPHAQDAEIVNIMVTAYCQNLEMTPPADQDPSQALTDFEQTAYDAVFSAPTQEHERGGWLYN